MEQRPAHERVKTHFDKAGLSYAQIAQEAERRAPNEWSERKVTRILTGVTDLKVEHLEIFADILGKPVAALLREVKVSKSEGRRAS